MNEAPEKKQNFSASSCHDTAQAILREFMDIIEAEAAKSGGSLTLAQIHEALSRLEEDREKSDIIYNKAFQGCFDDFNDHIWNDKRTNVVGRLIVEKFVHMLAPAEGLDQESPKISRDILTPFFIIMNMAVSEDRFKKANESVTEVMERLRSQTGRSFVWDEMAKNPEARRLANELMVSLAMHFENLETRKNWFIRIINDHLRNLNEEAGGGGDFWLFRDEHFFRLVTAMYGGLAQSSHDSSMAAKFDKYYGDGVSERIITLYDWAKAKAIG